MDLTCHLAAKSLLASDLIDRPMQIKHRPGGIGAVAYNHVVGVRNADPELIVAASLGSALNLATGKFGRYGAKDVRWLAGLGADYGMIAVVRDAPWNTLDELIAAMAMESSTVAVGGGGSIGSQDWIKIALIARSAGLDPDTIRFVPFEGGGEALGALLENFIQVFSGEISEIYPYLASGRVRILAVLADQRLPGQLATVPTAKEQGYDVEWRVWRGYYMGPQVSDESYNWWVNTFRRLTRTAEFIEERDRLGFFPFVMIGREFEDYVLQEVDRQRRIATELGLIP